MLTSFFIAFFNFFKIRMPWQGDPNNMIDRFDVRANLDIIPEYNSHNAPRYATLYL